MQTLSQQFADFTSAGCYGDGETQAEFLYRLRDDGMVELVALISQPDAAAGRDYTFQAGHKIAESEYSEDEATDLEYETRNLLHAMGVNGWASGRFSESVASAVDRAATTAAVAAE